jgi:uncharacterized protein
MARLSYAAPGVYVEEVPSAQQPIAPVGTNTVAFIGIVGEEILYPIQNEFFDPVEALAIARAASAAKPGAGGAKGKDSGQLAEEALGEAKADLEKALKNRANKFGDLAGPGKPYEKVNTARSDSDKDDKGQFLVLDAAPDAPDGVDPQRFKKLFEHDREVLVKAEKRVEGANNDLAAAKAAGSGAAPAADAGKKASDPSLIRPINLEKFTIEVPPCATKLVTNFSEYTAMFGGFSAYDEAGNPLFPGHQALTHAVYGFFQNGGSRAFVTRVRPMKGKENEPGVCDPVDFDHALEHIESIDAVAIISAPGLADSETWEKLIAHCKKCEDRFAILDGPSDLGFQGEDGAKDERSAKVLDVEKLQLGSDYAPGRSPNAAFYVPYVEVVDPAKKLQDSYGKDDKKYWGRTYVSPTGHVAGVYARTDEERGVHKAPANAALLGAINVKYYINKARQEDLNPKGINCIRDINGNITVWGARTIGGDANAEWKYINVRRFFLFLRESIEEGTQWCVFEPNDPQLWGKIKRNVSAFLTQCWRAGALFGATPGQAFYVKCDEETNPPDQRDLGWVVTEIGVAIVRPAEFVIFRITQSTGPAKG